MPKYMALIYRPKVSQEDINSPEFQNLYLAYGPFTERAAQAGVLRGGDGLQPIETATTVRVRDGKTLTTDGPFAETREWLAGYYIFECKDLDEAIQWAAGIPNALDGSIELRPVIER